MSKEKLHYHIHETYFYLRVGIAAIAILLPFVLWLGGEWYVGTGLLDSMSDYYHKVIDGKSMRDWFVGILFVIGVFLYLYKGFTAKENLALNLGGLFEIGVAIFPMDTTGTASFTLHGFCAISFFLCIAYVCIWRASDTLYILNDPVKEKKYKTVYKSLGIAMVLSPLIAYLLTVFFKQYSALTFFLETVAVWVFGTYWIIKSKEFSETKLDEI